MNKDTDNKETVDISTDSCYDRFMRACAEYTTRNAVYFKGKYYSYSDLASEIDTVASALIALGHRKGDFLTMMLPDTVQVPVFLYACSKIGMVLSVPRYESTTVEILMAMKTCQSKTLVIADSKIEGNEQIFDSKSLENIIICTSGKVLSIAARYRISQISKTKNVRVLKYKQFLKSGLVTDGKLGEEISKADCKTDVLCLHTGGASGIPLPTMFSCDKLNQIQENALETLGLTEKNVKFGFSSFSCLGPEYACDISFSLHGMLCCGITVIMNPFDEIKRSAYLIRMLKPQILVGFPNFYTKLSETAVLNEADLSFLTNVLSVGVNFESFDRSEFNEFLKERGFRGVVQETYHITEALSFVSLTSKNGDKPESIGLPVPDTKIEIIDSKTDSICITGTSGEICIYTESHMNGYYGNAKVSSEILQRRKDGRIWIHTGDIGHKDKEGYVYFEYMKKRCININGKSIYPSPIENIIKKLYGVEDAVVTSEDDPEYPGEKRLVAYILPEENYFADNEKLEKLRQGILHECELLLMPSRRPKEIYYRAYFPKNRWGMVEYDKFLKPTERLGEKINRS